MVALLVWVTVPGGGVYPWVWVPAACFTLALAVRTRPQVAARAERRAFALDLALIATAIAIAVQLAPLPGAMLQAIDPHAAALRRALWLANAGTALPVSVLPSSTLEALVIFAASVVLYWTCRPICTAGGTGRIVRGIAIAGLLASLVAIIQHSPGQQLLYGYWRPRDPGARPYGPFVNRNHFATWLIMACPLVVGYLLARAPSPSREARGLSQRIVRAATELGSMRIWLAAAVCLMALAVVLSTSRSGVIGLTGALILVAWLWRGRGRQLAHTRGWMIVQGAMLVMVVLTSANFGALSERLDETVAPSRATVGRPAIWRDTTRIIGDFAWTGTGAGTFGAAIIPYQTAAPGYSIGQAHNQYLQVAAEGGVLIAVPALVGAGAFVLLLRRRLAGEPGSTYLIRAGAAAGMGGVLLQSVWETGLRMPANALLFAVLAAIATHHRTAAATDGRNA